MKRVGRLYPQFIDRENIRKAIINSSKRKRDRATVKRCYENQEETIDKILDILENGWRPLQPHTFVIYDSHRQKDRTISCPKYFPDQIIHHALMQVLIPVFMRGMYHHSYGSIPGRGAHAAVRNVHKWMKNDRKKTKYCLQLDISKYYHSINHVMLRHSLVLKIKDRNVLKKSRHNLKDYQSVASYKGVVEHSDCNKIYCSVRRLTKALRKKVVMCGGTE